MTNKEVFDTWQNANSAEKMCHSALRFPIHTDAPTEHGSPTLKELRQLLTALPREFMPALVAFAQVRLQEPFDLKRMIKRLLSGSLFFYLNPILSVICRFCRFCCGSAKGKTQLLVILTKEYKRFCFDGFFEKICFFLR